MSTLVEVSAAAAMSYQVDSRFDQRGGLILVSFPGHLKTSILKTIISAVPKAVGYSDLTTQDLIDIKSEISQGLIQTIALYELQKIYERRPDTASNIIGNVRALMDEGFAGRGKDASFLARAMILAATTPDSYDAHLKEWKSTGFSRRVLVCKYRLRHRDVVRDAIIEDEPLKLGRHVNFIAPMGQIPLKISYSESLRLARMLHAQAEDTALILAKKIVSVLKWKAAAQHLKDNSMELFEDFSEGLNSSEALVDLS